MEKNLSFFERYLSVWVFLCIIGGILLGKAAPGIAKTLNDFFILDKDGQKTGRIKLTNTVLKKKM